MRTKKSTARRQRRKRLLKAASGFWGRRSRTFRNAKETLRRAWRFGWISRRVKKREYRGLWITRLTAAVRARGINYSGFMLGLKLANVGLNRKILADLAISDPAAFDHIVALAKEQLTAPAASAR